MGRGWDDDGTGMGRGWGDDGTTMGELGRRLHTILPSYSGASASEGDALATMYLEGSPSNRSADCCGKSEHRSLTGWVTGAVVPLPSVPPKR